MSVVLAAFAIYGVTLIGGSIATGADADLDATFSGDGKAYAGFGAGGGFAAR